jgi:ABC-type ATPase with predicted acetyltransferase domain
VPTVNVEVRCDTPITTRMRQVCAMFDAPIGDKTTRSWVGEMPIEDRPWQVGLIVGPSGCGKSTIARRLFGDEVRLEWPADRAVVDCFPESATIAEITGACSAVGFNTIPAWLRPHGTLSNGEKFRVELARLLLESPTFAWVDEFTSVVDRVVAKAGSHAVQRYVRADPARRFVAVGCHYDVIDWLQPDWTFEPATMTFTWRSLRRRPSIDAEIRRVPRALWRMFAPYHYMSAELHSGATCYALHVEDRPVAFAGILPVPSRAATAPARRSTACPDA